MPCGVRIASVGNERFPLPLPQPLQIIPQLILNRAGAEFVESIRGVIFYRGSFITYIKLYMLLCLYMACLCVCTIAHTPRGPAMHSDNKTDKTDMLAGKYQFQYQLRIQLQLQFQFRFLFRLLLLPSASFSWLPKKCGSCFCPCLCLALGKRCGRESCALS